MALRYEFKNVILGVLRSESCPSDMILQNFVSFLFFWKTDSLKFKILKTNSVVYFFNANYKIDQCLIDSEIQN